MNNRILRVVFGILILTGLTSCASVDSGNKAVTQKATPQFASGEGDIIDINNGEIIGKYVIAINGKESTAKISLGCTKAITSMDGTKDFVAFDGSFANMEEISIKNGKVLKFCNESNAKQFLVITPYATIPANYKGEVEGRNSFTISIMDDETAKTVFDASSKYYNPVFSVYAIKTFMTTQALIVQ